MAVIGISPPATGCYGAASGRCAAAIGAAASVATTFIGVLSLALVLGAMPSGSAGSIAGDAVRIAVISNGFHSDIALPATGDTLERLNLTAADYPVDRELVSYWAVGWGSREAYTSLVAVSDLSVGLVARAVSFDRTVMHVQPTGPLGGANVWFIDLPAERYDALLTDLAGWFASTEPDEVTQGFGDRFYVAHGRFTAWFTCNAWVGERLRNAGVSMGRWTPSAQSLAFGLDRFAGGSQE